MYPMLLSGLRILDLSILIPGATTTSILADLGADVIKVEPPPVGDYLRDLESFADRDRLSGQHMTLNRNKRSLPLNVRAEGGREVFERLLRSADAVVDVSVPGSRERLGLDYSSCVKLKPDIVYVSLSAYGYTGKYAGFPAHGVGPEVLTGHIPPQRRADGGFTFDLPEVRVPAAGSALFAAVGVLAGLRYREVTGRGLWLETSQADTGVWWQQLGVFRALNAEKVAKPAVVGGGAARYNFYECADGKLLLIMPIEEKFWRRFCEIIDRPDLKERGTWGGGALDFGSDDDDDLEGIIAEQLARRNLEYWLEALEGIPVIPAMSLQQLLEDEEYVAQREMVTEYDDPRLGPTKIASMPLKAPGMQRGQTRGAPDLGEDTDDVLAELGYDGDNRTRLRMSGAVFGDSR